MKSEEWLKEVTVDMIPENYRELAETIGVQSLIQLSQYCGGSMMYIPKSDTLTKSIRDKKIKQEFDGGNYKLLARKYNLSENAVRSIVNQDMLDGQITLF